MIQFFISGRPVPQGRPRTFWHKGLRRFCTINPTESEAWKETVTAKAFPYRPKEPIDFPVRVKLDFYIAKPIGKTEKIWADVRPDLDNLIKAILDGLQNARFFRDDARVVWIEARKQYSQDGRVGVDVTVLAI